MIKSPCTPDTLCDVVCYKLCSKIAQFTEKKGKIKERHFCLPFLQEQFKSKCLRHSSCSPLLLAVPQYQFPDGYILCNAHLPCMLFSCFVHHLQSLQRIMSCCMDGSSLNQFSRRFSATSTSVSSIFCFIPTLLNAVSNSLFVILSIAESSSINLPISHVLSAVRAESVLMEVIHIWCRVVSLAVRTPRTLPLLDSIFALVLKHISLFPDSFNLHASSLRITGTIRRLLRRKRASLSVY